MTFISHRVTHIIELKTFRLVSSKHKIQRQKNKITVVLSKSVDQQSKVIYQNFKSYLMVY